MRGAPEAVDAEVWVLTTAEGTALLDEVRAAPRPGPADLARWRRAAGEARTRAALGLAQARTKGAAKFARADRMWLEPTGVEQATAEPVARHKASRFAGRAPAVVDLCCGVGGDALALAPVAAAGVVAVDRDPGMCRRTRWNAGVYGVADRVLAVRSTAEAVGLPPGAWVHVDPDRRAGGAGRARALADYAPGLPFLRALAREAPGGAIKLGPASDFDAHFGGDGFEIELVSLGGECKEATAWFGAAVTCRRRASCLPAGATWTDRDADPDARAPLLAPGAWVFDPDPSLVRAGLVDGFAAAHGLGRFEPGVDYLTGPDRVDSPFLAAFAVLDVLPYDPKRLGRALAAHGVGRLEVKTRGATPRPEAVRARLRPKGDEAATLLLARGAGAIRAVLARRAGDGGGA